MFTGTGEGLRPPVAGSIDPYAIQEEATKRERASYTHTNTLPLFSPRYHIPLPPPPPSHPLALHFCYLPSDTHFPLFSAAISCKLTAHPLFTLFFRPPFPCPPPQPSLSLRKVWRIISSKWCIYVNIRASIHKVSKKSLFSRCQK